MLYLYLVGKMERQNMKMMFRGGSINQMMFKPPKQNRTVNTIYMLATLALYAISVMQPEIANNGVNLWFMSAVSDIKETIIIGWIIKVVGIFFLINIIVRGVTQTQKLVNGLNNSNNGTNDSDNFTDQNNQNDQGYDDYEIVE